MKVLQHFDGIDLFPREKDGPILMLIVDGHQSHLDPFFVEYINNREDRWKVCLGVPYATTLWQVDDASEQNGFVTSEWYREKAKLVVWKTEHGLPRAICPEDVMPIMNRIFFKAYGYEKNNRKATAEHGWFPPNRKLVEHPSLVRKQKETVLNVDEGFAGSILYRLL